ncbi:MAG TPA: permease-like cell division protein FtsX [Globicatella sulfidifaciens]|uniref:Cell division protein FtsX n=1 Tax=Globicatella sulfidifaciens DSM 15739 TaxID=1121925 RepID=A0A1T4K870_9LACT|nr:permease-like cell division protein FtsX [Globicatella sulfidifaciens]SJZ38640.1 cell division protein FtsX [Globicatella sulfidifaciens DSM 15739]HJF17161.1 permease-like cell division protein FtsX [Globicatella sulfidifaciens]
MIIIRNFFRHVRDGIRNLFRNGWMTTASVFTMALTLFMIGGLVLLLTNIEKITSDIESSIQIRVMIDAAANEQDEKLLKEEIQAIQHVKTITYRTKDEELEALIENVGEEFALHEGDANPLLNVYVVDVDDVDNISQVANQINDLKYVSEATYGALTADNLFKQIDVLRYILAVIAAILIVVAVLLISNTIRLTIFARQTEIEIMRLVGAKNSFIRAPFAYEGAFIGILGAGIAFGILYAIYEAVRRVPGQIFGMVNIQFLPTMPLLLYIGIGILIIGIILGIFGARRSMRQFLRI